MDNGKLTVKYRQWSIVSDLKLYIILPAFVEIKNTKANPLSIQFTLEDFKLSFFLFSF